MTQAEAELESTRYELKVVLAALNKLLEESAAEGLTGFRRRVIENERLRYCFERFCDQRAPVEHHSAKALVELLNQAIAGEI